MLEHVAENHFKAFGGGGALESFCYFGGHSGVGFAGDDFSCFVENFGCQVACAGSDFEDDLKDEVLVLEFYVRVCRRAVGAYV